MSKILILLIIKIILTEAALRDKAKIIKGDSVGENERYPFMVYIEPKGCGGSLIGLNIILTAAHCVAGYRPYQLRISAACSSITPSNCPNGQIREPDEYIVHPDYNPNTQENEIALIFLANPFRKTRFVDMIDPPSDRHYVIGSNALLLGWGRDERGNYPDWLRKTRMTIISNDECIRRHPPTEKISDKNICAFNADHSSTGCEGDSGGPFIYNDKLIGIVVGGPTVIKFVDGKQTCDTDLPLVFTKTQAYKTWIWGAVVDYRNRKNRGNRSRVN